MMMRPPLLALLLLIGCGNYHASDGSSGALAAPACVPSVGGVYVLGSSYSWGAQPYDLDNDPEWHIFCAKPLDYIFHNPYAHCVETSTPWPDVLEPPAQTYDYISFQPIKGTGITQQQDIDHISHWLSEQPACTVALIHTTWPQPADWEAELHDPDPDHTFTNHSLAYFYDLKAELERVNPGRIFALTRVNEMLDFVRHDPLAPILFEELFEDAAGHVSHGYGRYLQHNAFRQAMGQETGVDNTVDDIDPDIQTYLDEVIESFPAR
jgi:hypothetical protein